MGKLGKSVLKQKVKESLYREQIRLAKQIHKLEEQRDKFLSKHSGNIAEEVAASETALWYDAQIHDLRKKLALP